jgi:hypothetical protein
LIRYPTSKPIFYHAYVFKTIGAETIFGTKGKNGFVSPEYLDMFGKMSVLD